jgi:hypothetical protein
VRIVLAVLMALHGLAHLVGFVGSWRLARLEGMPYKTTVLAGRLDLGDAGIRAVGVLWLLLAIGFLIAAIGAIGSRPWWMPAAFMAAGVSLALCLLQWPDSRIGVPVNLVILIALLVGRRYGAL